MKLNIPSRKFDAGGGGGCDIGWRGLGILLLLFLFWGGGVMVRHSFSLDGYSASSPF